jgi:hypothetical protein
LRMLLRHGIRSRRQRRCRHDLAHRARDSMRTDWNVCRSVTLQFGASSSAVNLEHLRSRSVDVAPAAGLARHAGDGCCRSGGRPPVGPRLTLAQR